MKRILKGPEPQEFTEWKETEGPTAEWRNLSGTLTGKRLHEALALEQGCLCCYCCMRIDLESGDVEHIKPRSRFGDLELEYSNLLASCVEREKPRRRGDLHCNKRKGNWYDEGLFVSPLDHDCERWFRYSGDGRILPVEQSERTAAAQETIERLGLNSTLLVRSRKMAIEGLLREIEDLNSDGLRTYLRKLNARDDEGRFTPFAPPLIYILTGRSFPVSD